MNKIKLIASDLDGTLLTSQKEITPRLQKALTSMRQRTALSEVCHHQQRRGSL